MRKAQSGMRRNVERQERKRIAAATRRQLAAAAVAAFCSTSLQVMQLQGI